MPVTPPESAIISPQTGDTPAETALSRAKVQFIEPEGAVERVTFFNPATGFSVV